MDLEDGKVFTDFSMQYMRLYLDNKNGACGSLIGGYFYSADLNRYLLQYQLSTLVKSLCRLLIVLVAFVLESTVFISLMHFTWVFQLVIVNSLSTISLFRNQIA